MNFSFNPFKWFKKEEETIDYPPKFASVELNPVAKSKGINDEFNKIIKIYEYGEVKEEIPYSKEIIDAIKKIDKIPIYEENIGGDEEYEFDSFEDIGFSKYKAK